MKHPEQIPQIQLPPIATHVAYETPMQRKRRELSADSAEGGRGWFFDPDGSEDLYIIGERIPAKKPRYSLEAIEREYVALLQELFKQYGYVVDPKKPIRLWLNVFEVSTILAEEEVLKSLKPRASPIKALPTTEPTHPFMRQAHRLWNWLTKRAYWLIIGLEGELTLDGDTLPLVVSHDFPKPGYEFFVPDHPEEPDTGKFCRPALRGELTDEV